MPQQMLAPRAWRALVARATALLWAGCVAASAQTEAGAAEPQMVSNTAMVVMRSGSGEEVVVYSNTDTFEILPAPLLPVRPAIQFLRIDESSEVSVTWRPHRTRAPGVEADAPADASPEGEPRRAPAIEAESLAFGEGFLVRITDAARNGDRRALEYAAVELSFGDDRERIWLLETAPGSGVFAGYLQPVLGKLQAGNGSLEINRGRQLAATYEAGDARYGVMSCSLQTAGASRVFDSATGEALSGARVRIVDAVSGEPARVLGIDGVSAYPASVETGVDVSDAAGNVYPMEAGEFLFPRLPAGEYRIEVDVSEENGYQFPSAQSDEALRALPGGYALAAGSRGETFAETRDRRAIDLPVDPLAGNFTFALRSAARRASIGDYFEVFATARNRNGFRDLVDAEAQIALPHGMRISSGSLRIGEARAVFSPIEGAERFSVPLGELKRSSEVDLRFLVSVAHAKPGVAVVRGVGRARRAESNEASFALRVDDPFMASTSTLLGRVVLSENGEATEQGVPNVGVYLESGALAITDANGRFHFDGLEPGAHVAQIDVSALPAGFRAVSLRGEEREKPFSRMVDLEPGSLWQVEFHLEREPPAARDEVASEPGDAAEPAGLRETDFAFSRSWIERQEAGESWLFPAADESPALPVARVVVQHRVAHRIEALLDGEPLPAKNFSGTMAKSDRSFAVSVWEGVPLKEGGNRFEIVRIDSFGNERGREYRSIHYASPPWEARLDAKASMLLANGKDSPVIALRLLDRDGFPAREGVTGAFEIDAPYQPVGFRDEDMRARPGVAARLPTYVVEKGGLVRIALEPTTVSGNVRVRLPLAGGESEIVAPLRGDRSDWIVVGITDGTLAYDTISGNMEPLPEGDPDDGYAESGRVALFAKGKIRGSWLLTAAYDTSKRQPTRGTLADAIDPDAYYTLYGDESLRLEEAPTRDKLYLKLERDAWAALYGAFQLDWKMSPFTRVDTAMHGVKADYRGEKVSVSAFQSEAGMRFGREEFRGHGAAGDYRLARGSIAPFSESLVVETRDRRRESVILDTRALRRDLDYTIDYALGTIRLNKPLFSSDADLNPLYLVVQYELFDETAGEVSGARFEARPAEGVELGGTLLRREDDFGASSMQSVDARVELPLDVVGTVEVARSSGAGASSGAYSAALQRRTERTDTEVFYREVESGFGLGNLSDSQLGARSIGFESRQRLGGGYGLRQSAYQDSELDSSASQSAVEVEALRELEGIGYAIGLRAIEETDETGETARVNQATAGLRKTMLDQRLALRLEREQSLDGSERIEDYPTRTTLGADYRIHQRYELNLVQEWNERGEESDTRTRFGVTAEPWAGAEIVNLVSMRGGAEAGSDLQSSIAQSWQVTPRWELEGGLERTFELERGDSDAAGSADDASSAYAEAHYTDDVNAIDARLERYVAGDARRIGLAASAKREQSEELGLLAGVFASWSEAFAGSTTDDIDLRLGIAWRPSDGGGSLLNRLDWKTGDRSGGGGDDSNWRIVNNLQGFFKLSERSRASARLGAKYARFTFDDEQVDSVSYYLGSEWRYDFLEVWDLGLHGRSLGNLETSSQDFGYGLSIGRRFGPDVWLSFGYNVEGVEDRDFEDSSYTRQGPFIRFRVKFDQDSVSGLLERIGER